MEKTGDLRWGIVAVNLRNEGFREIDDYIVKTPSSYRMVRSHLDYIDWTKNRTIAKYMLALPSVHLVTITVTESGYAPGSPLFEYLACGLRNRKTPITVLCCDNIRQNGHALEAQFLAYLYQTNQYEMADWVRENVKFPSCMVDRITPSIDMELPFDIDEYVETVEERFSNSTNVDDLERICMDGFTKFHTFIVPSLRVCLEQGKRPIHTYRSIAAWYIYARKFAKGCKKIKYTEPNWLLLEPLLRDGAVDAFVSNERLWGDIPKTYITFSRDLKTILMSQTYEQEIDLLVDE
jgi:mannitol-1-phosphate/altronate dehydrogenase